jgi:hypothetical protein
MLLLDGAAGRSVGEEMNKNNRMKYAQIGEEDCNRVRSKMQSILY